MFSSTFDSLFLFSPWGTPYVCCPECISSSLFFLPIFLAFCHFSQADISSYWLCFQLELYLLLLRWLCFMDELSRHQAGVSCPVVNLPRLLFSKNVSASQLTIGQRPPSSWLMPTCFVLLSKVFGEPVFPSQELGRNVLILVSAIIFIQMLQYLADIPDRLRKQCSVKNMTLEYTWGWVSYLPSRWLSFPHL